MRIKRGMIDFAAWFVIAIVRECPNAQLKEIEERKGRNGLGVEGTVALLLDTKTVIGADKDVKNRPEIF